MNGPANDSDDDMLEARFRREHTQIDSEPFVRLTLARIARERTQVVLIRRTLRALALIAVIVASPWLIAASVQLSALLDETFDLASAWLATPAGTAAATLAALIVAALYRWRHRTLKVTPK